MVRLKCRYFLVEYILCENSDTLETLSSPKYIKTNETSRIEPKKLSSSFFANLLRSAVNDNFGLEESSACLFAFSVKYHSVETKSLIIRCPRSSEFILKSCLLLSFDVTASKLVFITRHVSGTLRSCQIAAIRNAKVRLKGLKSQIDLDKIASEINKLS